MRNRNALPALDLLVGFEAAARHLSFTKAGEELFLTQSAVSRQIKELEDQLGVPLFERRHRALALTPAGHAFHRDVSAALSALATAADTVHGAARGPGVTLSTTVSFASLWVIPRLSAFRARHPDTEVYISADDRLVDLGRGEVDIAVRYLPDAKAPEGAVRLFGERMMPVVSPGLVRRGGIPLATPSDLARHVLLHLDDRLLLVALQDPDLAPAVRLRVLVAAETQQAKVTAALARAVLEGAPARPTRRPSAPRSSGLVAPGNGGVRSREKMVWDWPGIGERLIEEWR